MGPLKIAMEWIPGISVIIKWNKLIKNAIASC